MQLLMHIHIKNLQNKMSITKIATRYNICYINIFNKYGKTCGSIEMHFSFQDEYLILSAFIVYQNCRNLKIEHNEIFLN